jgi:hypothetical protein
VVGNEDTVVNTAPNNRAARRLALLVQAAVVLVLALLAFGWSRVPAASPIAAVSVLIAYAAMAHVSVMMARPGTSRIQWVTLACGSVSAAVLIGSLAVQYFGRTSNNAVMVAVVFGLWLVAGLVAAASTGRIRDATLSSALSAEIGSLANVGFILASYYVMRGSPLQEQFFRIEGTYDDFARSGGADFGVFVMGDLFGGAFFHLLLGGLFGLLLGTIGGSLIVGGTRVFKRPGDQLPNASALDDRRAVSDK